MKEKKNSQSIPIPSKVNSKSLAHTLDKESSKTASLRSQTSLSALTSRESSSLFNFYGIAPKIITENALSPEIRQQQYSNLVLNPPAFYPPPKLSDETMEIHALHRFRKKQFSRLKKDIFLYRLTDTRINNFFLLYGEKFLVKSLKSKKLNLESLNFLLEIVQTQILQTVLRKANYAPLKIFITVQTSLEEEGSYNAAVKKFQISIFTLLLKIDQQGIYRYIQDYLNHTDSISNTLLDNFSIAYAGLAKEEEQRNEPEQGGEMTINTPGIFSYCRLA